MTPHNSSNNINNICVFQRDRSQSNNMFEQISNQASLTNNIQNFQNKIFTRSIGSTNNLQLNPSQPISRNASFSRMSNTAVSPKNTMNNIVNNNMISLKNSDSYSNIYVDYSNINNRLSTQTSAFKNGV